MRVSDIDAVEENDNEIERGQGDNRDDSEPANTEVVNTHTVQGIEKDSPTSLQTRTGPKDWPRKNEHPRIQPAGNRASSNQID